MVIKCLQNFLATLITIIDLDLLVLVTDQFLHVNATGSSHSEHDAALVRQLLLVELWLLDLKVFVLLVLLGPHRVLGNNSGVEFIKIRVRRLRELKDVPLEEGAGFWLIGD